MMPFTLSAAPAPRRKGPPTPLNLPLRSNSVPAVVATGPDFIEHQHQLHASAAAAHPIPAEKPAMMPRGPGSTRNIKRLSLSVVSIPTEDVQKTALPPSSPTSHTPAPQPSILPQHPPKRRSVVSLPAGASASSVLRRNDEGDDASAAAYLDGPIEIMPGIWLGSEDNARDWKGLAQRGIKAILNVAKEVASPFDSNPNSNSASVRNAHAHNASTPNLSTTFSRYTSTYQPAHLPSGRPSMYYLKLAWSHGQADLVRTGFVEAMNFVDEALNRHQGVLIQ